MKRQQHVILAVSLDFDRPITPLLKRINNRQQWPRCDLRKSLCRLTAQNSYPFVTALTCGSRKWRHNFLTATLRAASQCPLVCFYCPLMMWHYIRPAAAHNVLSALRHSSLPEGRSSYRVFHSNYPHIPESVAAIMAASGDGLSSTVRLRLAGDCAPTALHGSE